LEGVPARQQRKRWSQPITKQRHISGLSLVVELGSSRAPGELWRKKGRTQASGLQISGDIQYEFPESSFGPPYDLRKPGFHGDYLLNLVFPPIDPIEEHLDAIRRRLPPGFFNPAPIPTNPFFRPPGSTYEIRVKPNPFKDEFFELQLECIY
jgi:hypothetical protein